MAKSFLIRGNAKVETIKKRFSELFPYLTVNFYTPEELEKPDGEPLHPISGEKRISEVRTVKNSEELTVVGQTKVATMEKRFKELYGLHVQICAKDESGQEYYTGDEFDEYSIAKLNSEMQGRGFVAYC